MLTHVLLTAVLLRTAIAQRPANISVCDYYTTALLKDNTAANQATLLILLVNTAVIGNYTQPNNGITVPGILAPGIYDSTQVSLAKYFNGNLASTNTGGSEGVSVNFLDGGGASPLMQNLAADDKGSNQYRLLTHLYEYFGVVLGCSKQGGDGFPDYDGSESQYQVHKFMSLTHPEVSYFIKQVILSAQSLGIPSNDLVLLSVALMTIFDYRCSPPTKVVPAQGAQLQSICSDSTCPLAMDSTCALYEHGLNGSMSTSVTSTRTTKVVESTTTVTAVGTAGMMNLHGTTGVILGTGIASADGKTTVTGVIPGAGGVNSTLIAVVGGTATVSSSLPRVTAFNGTVVVSGFGLGTAAPPLASGAVPTTGSAGTVVGVFPNGTTIISNGASNDAPGSSGLSSIIPSNDTASIAGAANNSDSTPVPGAAGSANTPGFGPFANGTAGQGGVVNGTSIGGGVPGVPGGVEGGIVGAGPGSGSGSGSGSGTGSGSGSGSGTVSGSGNGGVPPQASDGVTLGFSLFLLLVGVVGLFL